MLSTSTFVPARHVLAAPRTQPAHGLHVSNGTQQVLRMSRKKTYNVEVVVPDGDNADIALRQFRRAVMSANIIPEVRRRQQFENRQDEKKRRRKELYMKRARQRIYRPPSYDEVVGGTEPAPFADMFGDPDDIFAEVRRSCGIFLAVATKL